MSKRVLWTSPPLVILCALVVLVASSLAITVGRDAGAAENVLWSADLENGDLSAWEQNGGGGEFNSANGDTVVSQDVAHSGSHSAKMTIDTSNGGDNGTRLHRWEEPRNYDKAYYSAWYYFPQRVQVEDGWWNIFQFKSRTSSKNDPWWMLYVGNRPDGSMYVYLRDWIHKKSYEQDVANLPVGRWVHLEVYLDQAGDNSGHLTVWQDGTQLFDMSGIQTRYPDGTQTWGITNYSSGLSPTPTTIYVDDAVISTGRVGTGGASSPAPANPAPPQETATPAPENPKPSSGLTWENPTDGATVDGTVEFRLTAPDGTAGIWFWRDNWVWLGDDYRERDGWNFTLNTDNLRPGKHTFRARAVDAQDRTLDEKVVTVTVR